MSYSSYLIRVERTNKRKIVDISNLYLFHLENSPCKEFVLQRGKEEIDSFFFMSSVSHTTSTRSGNAKKMLSVDFGMITKDNIEQVCRSC